MLKNLLLAFKGSKICLRLACENIGALKDVAVFETILLNSFMILSYMMLKRSLNLPFLDLF